MPESEITLGEVFRGVQATREDISTLRTEVAARPDQDDLKRVELGLLEKIQAEREARETKNTTQDLAIQKLEGWGNWGTKLALGGIASAALVALGLGGKVPL